MHDGLTFGKVYLATRGMRQNARKLCSRGNGAIWVRVDVLDRLRGTFARKGYQETLIRFTNAYDVTYARFE